MIFRTNDRKLVDPCRISCLLRPPCCMVYRRLIAANKLNNECSTVLNSCMMMSKRLVRLDLQVLQLSSLQFPIPEYKINLIVMHIQCIVCFQNSLKQTSTFLVKLYILLHTLHVCVGALMFGCLA